MAEDRDGGKQRGNSVNRLTLGCAALAVLIGLGAAPAAAVTYNPFTAFNVSGGVLSFPNFVVGNWSAGTVTPHSVAANNGYGNGIDVAWAEVYQGAYKNVTGSVIGTSQRFEIDRLQLHPGSTNPVGLAFVAPAAGQWRFIGEFSRQHFGLVTVGANQGATSIFSLDQPETPYQFDFTRTLALGEQLAFSVAPKDGYAGDLTGLLLNVSSVDAMGGVPEPESWALLLTGFGLVGAVARRRRHGLVVTA